jgi:RES domain
VTTAPPIPSVGELLPVLIPANSIFVRIHKLGQGALWFGPERGTPPANRFDAPNGEFRTLYGADRLEGAFAETILRRARRIIARDYVELRQWSLVRTLRDLKLAKLFDNGLIWHGVTADIGSGDDYRGSQAFSAGLHAAHGDCDGIAYRARHNNGEICYALFDRVDVAHLLVLDSRHFRNERSITEDLMRIHNASWDPMTPLTPSPP